MTGKDSWGQEQPFGFDTEDDMIREERTQWLDPIVIVSGGFDPPHEGHIAMFNEAAKYGKVHVLLNSDDWLVRKKGAALLPWSTRKELLVNLSSVHKVWEVNDLNGTVCEGLKQLKILYPHTKLFFANGGDRKVDNTPELEICHKHKIAPLWHIGGEKINSSSELLSNYEHKHGIRHMTSRDWGTYEIIAQGKATENIMNWLTKILTIWPRKNISLQRHFHREERWLILEGEGEFFSAEAGRWPVKPSDQILIPINNSHWIANTSYDTSLVILETWIGDKLEESDIERIENELTIS
jgi:cytidyltransferase-like protein